MRNELYTLLATFGYPVRLQGSFAPDEQYPDSFFTVWNNYSADNHHYDNEPFAFEWSFDVNFYSVDPTLVITVIEQTRTLLRTNGWIIDGKGMDVSSGVQTHTGRQITALYNEQNQ